MFGLRGAYFYLVAIQITFIKFLKKIYFSSGLYNKSLISKVPAQVFFSPNPFLLSLISPFTKNSFKINEINPNEFWFKNKKIGDNHNFLWLNLIDRKSDGKKIQKIIYIWMTKYSKFEKKIWETSALSSRIISWILNIEIIINNTTFEFKTNLIGAQDTILAGGRYDGLSKMISNFSLPGVGWAAGIERIALMIEKKYTFNPLVVLIPQMDIHTFKVLEFYKKLLDVGIRTEMIYSGSLNKKLKRANKISAKFAVIVGNNEIKKNVVQLKNFQNGEQVEMKFEELITMFKSMDVSNC